ncbi:MAG: TonB-dependent receptor [bacterium]|nr:TonB-dependent receptor [bacterium]
MLKRTINQLVFTFVLTLLVNQIVLANVKLPDKKVIGDTESDLKAISGTAHVVSAKDIFIHQPANAGEMLQTIPGVMVRDEDGNGYRLNIGVRGMSSQYASKMTVLEDGVPISLSPYGNNELLYSPSIFRIERLELIKGADSILYGPHTTGGVLNFVTKDVPRTPMGHAALEVGSNALMGYQIGYGNTHHGFGYLVDYAHKQGEGWRHPYHHKSDDVTTKFKAALSENSDLRFKFHYHVQDTGASTKGLTPAQYADDHTQNPADNGSVTLERSSLSVQHDYTGFNDIIVRTTAFSNWTRTGQWTQEYDRSEWINNGNWVLGNGSVGRERFNRVTGIEPTVEYGNWLAGIKLHFESEEVEDLANATISDARFGDAVNAEERTTIGTAVYGRYRYDVNEKWTIIPAARLETYRQTRHILLQNGANEDEFGANAIEVAFLPAVSTTYDLTNNIDLFSGIHAGYSPASYADAFDNNANATSLEPEKSINFEVGTRTKWFKNTLFADATIFYNDFQNEVIPSTGEYNVVNAGHTTHMGLELELKRPFKNCAFKCMSLTPKFSATLQEARIIGNRTSSTGADLSTDQDRLPYVPSQMFALGVDGSYGEWSGSLEAVFTGAMLAYDLNTETASDAGSESANGLRGDINEYTIWNLSIAKDFKQGFTSYLAIKNLFDLNYIASRQPQGIFPGAERQINVGLTTTF